jgi:propionyl-CoA carboxylase alpha chain
MTDTKTKQRTINTLLVANRGEIARRVFATCRGLGIGTVAVYSDADVNAPHTQEADVAVRLPGSAPADTYLRADLIIQAALATGADAVHPGYGFLSENPDFAQAVIEAGLTWVGPPPAAIAAMGSKTEAKRLMAAAGVPVLSAIDPARATEADLPLLVKAAAGGGGRGMRIVRDLAELPDALAAAGAEAASAFGSDEVFCEPYVGTARHVEAQILADTHGTVWVVGERDCSIQRRHQKIIEEAPASGITDEIRGTLYQAAEAAARAVHYSGAGTVEFLLAPDGKLFFLEVNTRLQVEHPVTEYVTGLDLVALQLHIAEGQALPGPTPPPPHGHAVEARLCAEDPSLGWLPQIGTLHLFDVPDVTARFSADTSTGTGLRLDSGVETGSIIGGDYDSLLAKVIAWAPTRAAAARKLAAALARARIHGVTTNRDLLVAALRHPAFLAGDVHTAFLAEHEAELAEAARPGEAAETLRISALAAALADAAANRQAAPVLGALPSGWRNLPSQPQTKHYRSEAEGTKAEDLVIRYQFSRSGSGLTVDGFPDVRLVSSSPTHTELEISGIRRRFEIAVYENAPRNAAPTKTVHIDSSLGAIRLTVVDRFPAPQAQLEPGGLRAPMPGTVIRIAVAQGDPVAPGQPLLWIEAMKMEHPVSAPADGQIAELRVQVGQQVQVGTVLAVIEPEGT